MRSIPAQFSYEANVGSPPRHVTLQISASRYPVWTMTTQLPGYTGKLLPRVHLVFYMLLLDLLSHFACFLVRRTYLLSTIPIIDHLRLYCALRTRLLAEHGCPRTQIWRIRT